MFKIPLIACFSSNCTKKVCVECHCSNPSKFLCSRHIKSHRLTKGSHRITYLPLEVLKKFDKEIVLEKIREMYEDLQKFKQATIKACSNIAAELMNKLAELLDHLREVEILITNIKTRINLDKAVNKDHLSALMNRNIKIDEFNSKEIIEKITENLNYKNFCGTISESKSYSYESHAEDENHILFVKTNEKNLYLLDLSTLKSRTIILNDSKIWDHGAACKIAANKYFISGGRQNGIYYGNTSIIDISFNSEKTQKSRSPKSHQSCIVKDSKIYIFGGYNGQYLKSAESFDLNTELWSSLSDMPFSSKTYSSIIDHKIILVGYFFLGIYVFQDNSYVKNLSLPQGHYNLCEKWIIGENKLYECTDLTKIIWREHTIAIPSPGNPFLKMTVKKNNMIYMMIDLHLWRIDTVQKSAEKIVFA